MSEKKVIFKQKSDWQKENCINQSSEFNCVEKSTLEAIFGPSIIRCCGNKKCMEFAKELAKNF